MYKDPAVAFPLQAVIQRDHCKCKQAGRRRAKLVDRFCHLDLSRSSHPKHSWSEAIPELLLWEINSPKRSWGGEGRGNSSWLLWPRQQEDGISPVYVLELPAPQNPWFLQQKHPSRLHGAEHNSWSFPCWRHFGIWIGSLSALPQECGAQASWLARMQDWESENKKWKPILVRHRFMKLLPSGSSSPLSLSSARVLRGQCLQPHGGGTWCWRDKASSLR